MGFDLLGSYWRLTDFFCKGVPMSAKNPRHDISSYFGNSNAPETEVWRCMTRLADHARWLARPGVNRCALPTVVTASEMNRPIPPAAETEKRFRESMCRELTEMNRILRQEQAQKRADWWRTITK